MIELEFNTRHSEVLVVIGAGATAKLGMPQTAEQSKLFRELSKAKDDANLTKILKEFFKNKDLDKMVSFLKVLDGNKDDSGNLKI